MMYKENQIAERARYYLDEVDEIFNRMDKKLQDDVISYYEDNTDSSFHEDSYRDWEGLYVWLLLNELEWVNKALNVPFEPLAKELEKESEYDDIVEYLAK